MKVSLVFFYISVLFISPEVQSEQFRGSVIKVLDGDTIEVLHNMTSVRIRLKNIDAPEKKQPFGEWSRQQLKSLVFDHPVTVIWTQKDRYGRILGQVSTASTDVNRSMVERGAAWVYSPYNSDPTLPPLQRAAQREKRGLWSEAYPIQPWKWRKSNG